MKALAKCKFFKEYREQEHKHVFIIPFHLREAGAVLKEWPMVTKGQHNYSHFIIDLRTPKQREDSRLNINTHTFKVKHDVWNEKPRLLHQE